MSVFVSDFKSVPGQWQVVHDDAPDGPHSGSVTPTSVTFTTNPDGSQNPRFLTVTCPVCGAVSTHPIGGGAQPASVQEMFIRNAVRAGCPCGTKWPAGRVFLLTLAHIRIHANAMDGTGRFQVPASISS